MPRRARSRRPTAHIPRARCSTPVSLRQRAGEQRHAGKEGGITFARSIRPRGIAWRGRTRILLPVHRLPRGGTCLVHENWNNNPTRTRKACRRTSYRRPCPCRRLDQGGSACLRRSPRLPEQGGAFGGQRAVVFSESRTRCAEQDDRSWDVVLL